MLKTSDKIFGVLLCSKKTDVPGIVDDVRATFHDIDERTAFSYLAKFHREGLIRMVYADNVPVEFAVEPDARAAFQDKMDAEAYKNFIDSIKISLGLCLGAFVAVIELIAR